MSVKVKALSTFVHGRLHAAEGGEYLLPKGEAEDLVKARLVEIVDAADGKVPNPMGEPQEHNVGDVVTDPDDDPLGEKMEADHDNKMGAPRARRNK